MMCVVFSVSADTKLFALVLWHRFCRHKTVCIGFVAMKDSRFRAVFLGLFKCSEFP